MNVHSVCDMRRFCTGWATACCTSIQSCGLEESSISFWQGGVLFCLQSQYIFVLFYFVAMDMDQYKFNLDVHGKDMRHGTTRLPLDGFS